MRLHALIRSPDITSTTALAARDETNDAEPVDGVRPPYAGAIVTWYGGP